MQQNEQVQAINKHKRLMTDNYNIKWIIIGVNLNTRKKLSTSYFTSCVISPGFCDKHRYDMKSTDEIWILIIIEFCNKSILSSWAFSNLKFIIWIASIYSRYSFWTGINKPLKFSSNVRYIAQNYIINSNSNYLIKSLSWYFLCVSFSSLQLSEKFVHLILLVVLHASGIPKVRQQQTKTWQNPF